MPVTFDAPIRSSPVLSDSAPPPPKRGIQRFPEEGVLYCLLLYSLLICLHLFYTLDWYFSYVSFQGRMNLVDENIYKYFSILNFSPVFVTFDALVLVADSSHFTGDNTKASELRT